MRPIVFTLVLSAALPTLAYAQTSHNPALTDPAARTTRVASSGRNSFTQDQAKGRIAKAGFSQVGKLVKDPNGIWQGHAMKDGKPVAVALDYKGDVTVH
jgi:hypothetical protein